VIPLNKEPADKTAFMPNEEEIKYMLSIRKKIIDTKEKQQELTDR